MSNQEAFDPAGFPRLRELARGYLHQDVRREYGSAQAAAKAYLADLNDEEQKKVANEATRLLTFLGGWSLAEANGVLGELGAAWRTHSKEELSAIMEALRLGVLE